MITAFARHLQRRALPSPTPVDADEAAVDTTLAEPPPLALAVPSAAPGLAGAYAVLAAGPAAADAAVSETAPGAEDPEAEESWWGGLRHNRLSRWLLGVLMDALVIYVMYRIVVRAWLYFMLDWTGI